MGHFYASAFFSSIINNKSVKTLFFDISLDENLYTLSLTQIGIKNTQIAVKLGKFSFHFLITVFWLYFEKSCFPFRQLNKKNIFPRNISEKCKV